MQITIQMEKQVLFDFAFLIIVIVVSCTQIQLSSQSECESGVVNGEGRLTGDIVEKLTLDDKTIDFTSCSIRIYDFSILKWCVSGLKSHTLKISTRRQTLAEGKDCVSYTIKKTSALSSVSVSFIEHNHCQRAKSYNCRVKMAGSTSIKLSNYARGSQSECKSGFVHGKDRIYYTGTLIIDDDIPSHYSGYFILQMTLKKPFHWYDRQEQICVIAIFQEMCAGDDDYVPNECECFENFTEAFPVVSVYMSIIADYRYSNSEAHILYLAFPDRQRYNSTVVKVPTIETDFVEKLTLDEKTINVSSCNFLIPDSSTVKWCVSGLRSHTLKISSGQQTLVEGKDECVSYTIKKTSSLSSVTVSFIEHSHCERVRSHDCGLKSSIVAGSSRSRASTPDTIADVVSRDALCLLTLVLFVITRQLFIW